MSYKEEDVQRAITIARTYGRAGFLLFHNADCEPPPVHADNVEFRKSVFVEPDRFLMVHASEFEKQVLALRMVR